jgi:hypothetical protein
MPTATALRSQGCLLALLFICGCGEQPAQKLINTTQQQYVLFSIPCGWSGSGGAPIFDKGGRVYFDGQSVLAKDQVQIQNAAGKSISNPRSIHVEAYVHLEPGSATISSDPPQTRSVIHLVIDKLIKAEWQTQELQR